MSQLQPPGPDFNRDVDVGGVDIEASLAPRTRPPAGLRQIRPTPPPALPRSTLRRRRLIALAVGVGLATGAAVGGLTWLWMAL